MSETNLSYKFTIEGIKAPGSLLNLPHTDEISWISTSSISNNAHDTALKMLECLQSFKNILQETNLEEYVIISSMNPSHSEDSNHSESNDDWEDEILSKSIIIPSSEIYSKSKKPIIIGTIVVDEEIFPEFGLSQLH